MSGSRVDHDITTQYTFLDNEGKQ
ncbi:hypothetical protein [Vibrio sp.]